MEEKVPASYKKINLKNSQFCHLKEKRWTIPLFFLGNFSSEVQTIENPSINAIDYASGEKEFSKNINLKPWGFKILVEK